MLFLIRKNVSLANLCCACLSWNCSTVFFMVHFHSVQLYPLSCIGLFFFFNIFCRINSIWEIKGSKLLDRENAFPFIEMKYVFCLGGPGSYFITKPFLMQYSKYVHVGSLLVIGLQERVYSIWSGGSRDSGFCRLQLQGVSLVRLPVVYSLFELCGCLLICTMG